MTRSVQTGLLLVDKPAGMTSHDVVARVRRAFGQREVGHAGTLDPAATGLLVMALGDATRLLRFVEAAEKAYTGTVVLGRATTTWDAEGDPVEEVEPPRQIDPGRLAAAIAALTGTITQRTPAFSAVKIDGVRSYARARQGDAVEPPPRTVEISALSATRVEPPAIELAVTVSKGTYVRSLAVALGAELGYPAHLAQLRRTRIGAFDVADAHALDALDRAALLPAATAVAHLARVEVDAGGLADVRHGRPLSAERLLAGLRGELVDARPLAVFDPDQRLVAIAEPRASRDVLERGPPRDPAVRYACVLIKPS